MGKVSSCVFVEWENMILYSISNSKTKKAYFVWCFSHPLSKVVEDHQDILFLCSNHTVADSLAHCVSQKFEKL
jgi:hypothetical protein